MVVCYNKVTGVAVVLQVGQEMLSEEICNMERNVRGLAAVEGDGEKMERNMVRMNI